MPEKMKVFQFACLTDRPKLKNFPVCVGALSAVARFVAVVVITT